MLALLFSLNYSHRDQISMIIRSKQCCSFGWFKLIHFFKIPLLLLQGHKDTHWITINRK